MFSFSLGSVGIKLVRRERVVVSSSKYFWSKGEMKGGLHSQTSVVYVKNPSTKSKVCESVRKGHAVQREKPSSIPRTT